MPTQLEMIIEALEKNGPMDANQLGNVIVASGKKIKAPKNSVLGLISTHPDLFLKKKINGQKIYSLAESHLVKKNCDSLSKVANDDFKAFKAFCRERLKKAGHTKGSNEEEAKLKLVLPMLRYLGYDDGTSDVSTEFNVMGKRTDIVLNSKKNRVFVEIKAWNDRGLVDANREQLKRYVSDFQDCSFGILTNGAEWRFFYGTGKGGKSILFPIGDLSIEAPSVSGFDVLRSFEKNSFNPSMLEKKSKEMLKKMMDGWEKNCLESITPDNEIKFPEKGDVATLKEKLKDSFEKWRKSLNV